ncbi:M23 family metallopeptidase [Geothrix sp. PMB-07]|uniref:M23 family metallopeptidase n=1 Tax=Geothrix sp. PMB-07 TaxID=3068640 RepID=UPI0027425DDA|nr:M23 family metallopeptidase [Geothrix sp. PMB-07]WLT33337.1 M23 family metallopeptidase [Geothrix sp. PMB-07]
MSTPQPERRRALRSSRPDSGRWLTVMVVFSHRTFRWSLTRRLMLWVVGGVAGFCALAMIGSGYGMWATKKIMSFGRLQQETREQQEQLRSSLDQAQALESEVETLRKQHTELLKLLDPKAQTGTPLPTPPGQTNAAPPPPGTQERLSKLHQDLDYTAKQAAVVRARMAPVLWAWSHTPSIPPTAGYLSSGFGVRVSPFSRSNESGDGLLGYHSGIDISNVLDTPIQVTADGEVIEAGWMDRYGWGVRVRHTEEQETLYAHLNRVDVKVGQKVSRGDILGAMGRSGNATGVHLHYEVRRNGKTVNPQPYLRLQRQWLSALGRQS